MTKQEEILGGIMGLLYPDKERIEFEWGRCDIEVAREDSCDAADELLLYLHEQGVVIKVERELPFSVCREMEVVLKRYASQPQYAWAEALQILKKAGYVAVESLIKEEK